MRTIIKKKPSTRFLGNNTFSLNVEDIQKLTQPDCEIHIYGKNFELQFIIHNDQLPLISFEEKYSRKNNKLFILADYSECSLSEGIFNITAKRASNKDPKYSITYNTSEFSKEGCSINFISGKKYAITYDNGEVIEYKATRNGTTLYSGKLNHDHDLHIPSQTGKFYQTIHRIKKIERVNEEFPIILNRTIDSMDHWMSYEDLK